MKYNRHKRNPEHFFFSFVVVVVVDRPIKENRSKSIKLKRECNTSQRGEIQKDYIMNVPHGHHHSTFLLATLRDTNWEQ